MRESTHLLDPYTAVGFTMKHGLYNENLKWKTKPYLLGQRDRQDSSSSAAWQLKDRRHEQGRHWTIDAHVLSDDWLQQCQCHQTDIRTFEQPFLTARSTIWHGQNGSNKVCITSGFVMQCTHMQYLLGLKGSPSSPKKVLSPKQVG